jgi:hypothetical protein
VAIHGFFGRDSEMFFYDHLQAPTAGLFDEHVRFLDLNPDFITRFPSERKFIFRLPHRVLAYVDLVLHAHRNLIVRIFSHHGRIDEIVQRSIVSLFGDSRNHAGLISGACRLRNRDSQNDGQQYEIRAGTHQNVTVYGTT